MNNVREIVDYLKAQWWDPREATHRGTKCPFLLACRFAPSPAGDLERFPLHVPPDVRDLWSIARRAALFKDEAYGQWGIEVLDPEGALEETRRQSAGRPHEFLPSDLVFARFLGDSELLVVRCDQEQSDYGSIMIALPIDKRIDWPVVAESFAEFLQRCLRAQGDKYWEEGV